METTSFLLVQAGNQNTPTVPGSGTPTSSTAASSAAGSSDGFSLLPQSGELAEAIRTGEIHLYHIPEFISYFIEVAIIAAGTISFLMLLIGGYQYIVGGVYSDMRDQGKTTITYAIVGLVLSMLSYAIVSIVQLFVTAL